MSDLSGDLSNNSFQDSDLLGDLSLFSFLSNSSQFFSQSLDSLSDNSDLVSQFLDNTSGLSDNDSVFFSDCWSSDWSDHLINKMVTTVSLGGNSFQSSSNFANLLSNFISLFLLEQFLKLFNEFFNSLIVMVTCLSGVVDDSGFNLSQLSDVFNSLDGPDDGNWVMEYKSWSNWNWSSNLMDSSSDVNNVFVNSSDSLSQDNDFLLDFWNSWLWSNNQFFVQVSDLLSDDSDLVSQFSDSTSVLSDDSNFVLAWNKWSWFDAEWSSSSQRKWNWNTWVNNSMNSSSGNSNSVSNLSDCSSQDCDLLNDWSSFGFNGNGFQLGNKCVDLFSDNSSLVNKGSDFLLVNVNDVVNFLNNRMNVVNWLDGDWTWSFWFRMTWVSQLMNSMSQVDNLSVDSLNSFSEDDNLLSDNWDLWLRSASEFSS